MANKFQLKRTSVAGRAANTSLIDVGELAINVTDQKLYSSNGTIVFEIGANVNIQYVNAAIIIGNSTVNSTITSTIYSGTANNSTNLNGVAADNYVQNTDSRTLSGNLTFTGVASSFNNGTVIGTAQGDLANNITLVNNFGSGNIHRLRFYNRRHTAGSTWEGVGSRIQSRVDVSDMAYLEFNPSGFASGAALLASNDKGLTLTSGGIVGVDGYRVARVNYQVITSTNTWYNPISNTSLNFPNTSLVIVELWGAGGSGARDGTTAQNRSGGGGGGYKRETFAANQISSTVTVTIGAGGAARSTNQAGANGGNTTFGTYLTAYGGGGGTASGTNSNGGGGGGWTGAGAAATAGAGTGATGDILFAGRTGASGAGAAGYYGGGAGGGAGGVNAGGNSVYGGAGGGARGAAGGTSIFGGAGGGDSTNGSQPGGGGGSSATTSGAGGDGLAKIWTIEIF